MGTLEIVPNEINTIHYKREREATREWFQGIDNGFDPGFREGVSVMLERQLFQLTVRPIAVTPTVETAATQTTAAAALAAEALTIAVVAVIPQPPDFMEQAGDDTAL